MDKTSSSVDCIIIILKTISPEGLLATCELKV